MEEKEYIIKKNLYSIEKLLSHIILMIDKNEKYVDSVAYKLNIKCLENKLKRLKE